MPTRFVTTSLVTKRAATWPSGKTTDDVTRSLLTASYLSQEQLTTHNHPQPLFSETTLPPQSALSLYNL